MPRASKREAVLTAAEAGDVARFLETCGGKGGAAFSHREYLEGLPKKQHARLWAALSAVTEPAAEAIRQCAAEPGCEADAGLPDSVSKEALRVVESATRFLMGALSADQPHVEATMQTLGLTIHDLLFDIPETHSKLQEEIAAMCSQWWFSKADGRDEVVPQTISFLIMKTIQPGATATSVKKVHALKETLLLLDFDDESAASLKAILQQCMISPLYLTTPEGKRFLSYLFGMSPAMVDAFHLTIKSTLPYCSQHLLEEFAEVYFRAWRSATGVYLERIEACIQNLMDHAVHAQKIEGCNMPTILRQVLDGFHARKKERGVDEALVRLYEPILWRALRVANATVRANAAALMINAFPLQDPDAKRQEGEELMQKQFDALKELLYDDAPCVRATAVQGVCRICSEFWELIPKDVLTSLLINVVTDLARDASAPAVRVAVFKGLAFLLDNHLCHPIMKKLLPELQELVHDAAERVRAAFLDLLLVVKGIRDIKFWHIVPVEHLLARLTVERDSNAYRIVNLLASSYVPMKKPIAVCIERCVSMCRADRAAARRFYSLVRRFVPESQLAKLVAGLATCIESAVVPSKRKRARKAHDPIMDDDSDEDDSDGDQGADQADDGIAVEDVPALLEIVAIVVGSIAVRARDRQDKAILKRLGANLKDVLSCVYKHFDADSDEYQAMLQLSSFLPSVAPLELCKSMLKRLGKMTATSDFKPVVDCLFAWGQMDLLLQAMQTSICLELNVEVANKRSKGTPAKATMRLSEALALAILEHCILLEARRPQAGLAQKLRPFLKIFKATLFEDEAELRASPCRPQFCLDALRVYYKLVIACSKAPPKDMLAALDWAAQEAIPVLNEESAKQQTKKKRKRKKAKSSRAAATEELCAFVLETVRGGTEVLAIGAQDGAMAARLANVTTTLLEAGVDGGEVVDAAARILCEMAAGAEGLAHEHEFDAHVTKLLGAILDTARRQSAEARLVATIRPMLTQVAKSWQQRGMLGAFLEILARAVGKTMHGTEHEDLGADLPFFAAQVAEFASRSRPMAKNFALQLPVAAGDLAGTYSSVRVLAFMSKESPEVTGDSVRARLRAVATELGPAAAGADSEEHEEVGQVLEAARVALAALSG